jgi:eukaryotic-like serine/threonine-protein kinase
MPTMEPGMLLKSRYKVLDQLGQGGMGEVYLATDETLDYKVAVKANHNLSTHASAQFIREARLLASLKHPNLPRVIDYFTENDSQYLVMDFIPGENLKVYIESNQEITFPVVLKWAAQLGNALIYLHTQNPPIYHRDIKPANIKLTPDGDVVLVDFGIAKTGDASQETQTGAWAFSPGFAPPEQVSGMRTGPYSDQFSLAATVYYLIARKPPADSARRMMGEEDLVPLIEVDPSLPDYFCNAINKALSIKPENRFSTIADFIGALTSPNPIPDPASAQKTVMGSVHPIPPSVTPPASQNDPITTPRPRKKVSALWTIIGIGVVLGVVTGGYLALKAMGFIGKVNQPIPPTNTPETIIVPSITETLQIFPTGTPQTTTPTETITPTAEVQVITPIGRGGKVAFVSNRQADGYNQIWLMDVGIDGSGKPVANNPYQVTFSPDDKSGPSWSPDGTKLLYSGLSTGFSSNGTPFANDIWMLDITQENSEPVDISKLAGDDFNASWSPTGDLIAFTSYMRGDKIPQLYTIKPDGSHLNLLQDPDTKIVYSDSYSAWTPGGEFLLYVYSTGELHVLQMRDRYSLYEKFIKFDRTTNEGRLGNVAEPEVSADGSMIVYTRLINNKTNIYSAAFVDRGGTVMKLTDTDVDYAPCWSPDTKWILFTSNRDDNTEIYIMDIAGSNVTNLTNLPSNDKEPAWQPIQTP